MFTMTAPAFESITFDTSLTEDAKPNFAPNARWEREYNALLNAVTRNVERILHRFSPNDPASSIEVIKELQGYAEKLEDWAKGKIGGIIYNLNDDSRKKWEKQSANISKYLRIEMEKAPIKGLLKQYMEENVKHIKSVPLNAAKKIEKIVLENLKTGAERAESLTEIVMQIGKLPESMRSRAKLIARTEIAKMSTGLVKARAVSSDINWYVWRSTHDIRVRSSHKLMDKVLVAWDDPASPEELDGAKKSYGHYHPGEIFNCRCYARPILNAASDISWPAKVYRNGKIQLMNQSDFYRLTGFVDAVRRAA
jgi:SPP1 gp7 family putative phage head morphogenesis protein